MDGRAPIGVFDSGLGGLTVVRELRRILPNEQIIYFGDIARLPYGIKSEQQIREFSKENTEFLVRHHVKAIVVACNSSSSAAYSYLSSHYALPVIDVIRPAARIASETTRNGRIGVIATQATVASRAYELAIRERNKKLRVVSKACPLLVPLVEEGVYNGRVIDVTLDRYLGPLLKKQIDTLLLGCTHYPLLHDAIRKAVGNKVRLIDSAPGAVHELKMRLFQKNALYKKKRAKSLQVYVSDSPLHFKALGARFLGESPVSRYVRYPADFRFGSNRFRK